MLPSCVLAFASQEYHRLSEAGESEEAIFTSLRDMIALQLDNPTERETLSTKDVRALCPSAPSLQIYISIAWLEP